MSTRGTRLQVKASKQSDYSSNREQFQAKKEVIIKAVPNEAKLDTSW